MAANRWDKYRDGKTPAGIDIAAITLGESPIPILTDQWQDSLALSSYLKLRREGKEDGSNILQNKSAIDTSSSPTTPLRSRTMDTQEAIRASSSSPTRPSVLAQRLRASRGGSFSLGGSNGVTRSILKSESDPITPNPLVRSMFSQNPTPLPLSLQALQTSNLVGNGEKMNSTFMTHNNSTFLDQQSSLLTPLSPDLDRSILPDRNSRATFGNENQSNLFARLNMDIERENFKSGNATLVEDPLVAEDISVDAVGLKILLKTALRDKDVANSKLIQSQEEVKRLQSSNQTLQEQNKAVNAITSNGTRWKLPCIILTQWSYNQQQRQMRAFFLWRTKCHGQQYNQALNHNRQLVCKLAGRNLKKVRLLKVQDFFIRWKSKIALQDHSLCLLEIISSQQYQKRQQSMLFSYWKRRLHQQRLLRRLLSRRIWKVGLKRLTQSFRFWKSQISNHQQDIVHKTFCKWTLRNIILKNQIRQLVLRQRWNQWNNKIHHENMIQIKRSHLTKVLRKNKFHPLFYFIQFWKYQYLRVKPCLEKASYILKGIVDKKQPLSQCVRRFACWKTKTVVFKQRKLVVGRIIDHIAIRHLAKCVGKYFRVWSRHAMQYKLEKHNLRSLSVLRHRQAILRYFVESLVRNCVRRGFQHWRHQVVWLKIAISEHEQVMALRKRVVELTGDYSSESTERQAIVKEFYSVQHIAKEQQEYFRAKLVLLIFKHCRTKSMAKAFKTWLQYAIIIRLLLKHDSFRKMSYQKILSHRLELISNGCNQRLMQCVLQEWKHVFRRRRLLRRIVRSHREVKWIKTAFQMWQRYISRRSSQYLVLHRVFITQWKRQAMKLVFNRWCRKVDEHHRFVSCLYHMTKSLWTAYKSVMKTAIGRWKCSLSYRKISSVQRRILLLSECRSKMHLANHFIQWKCHVQRYLRGKMTLALMISNNVRNQFLIPAMTRWRKNIQYKYIRQQGCKTLVRVFKGIYTRVNLAKNVLHGERIRAKQYVIFYQWKNEISKIRFLQGQQTERKLYQSFETTNKLKHVLEETQRSNILLQHRQEDSQMQLMRLQLLMDKLIYSRQYHRGLRRVLVAWKGVTTFCRMAKGFYRKQSQRRLLRVWHKWYASWKTLQAVRIEKVHRTAIEKGLIDKQKLLRFFFSWKLRTTNDSINDLHLMKAISTVTSRTNYRVMSHGLSVWKQSYQSAFYRRQLVLHSTFFAMRQNALLSTRKRRSLYPVIFAKLRAYKISSFTRWLRFCDRSRHHDYAVQRIASMLTGCVGKFRAQQIRRSFSVWKRCCDLHKRIGSLVAIHHRTNTLIQLRKALSIWQTLLTFQNSIGQCIRLCFRIKYNQLQRQLLGAFGHWKRKVMLQLPHYLSQSDHFGRILRKSHECRCLKQVFQRWIVNFKAVSIREVSLRKELHFDGILNNWKEIVTRLHSLYVLMVQSSDFIRELLTITENTFNYILQLKFPFSNNANMTYPSVRKGSGYRIRLFVVRKDDQVIYAKRVNNWSGNELSMADEYDYYQVGEGLVGKCVQSKAPAIYYNSNQHDQNSFVRYPVTALVPLLCESTIEGFQGNGSGSISECIAVLQFITTDNAITDYDLLVVRNQHQPVNSSLSSTTYSRGIIARDSAAILVATCLKLHIDSLTILSLLSATLQFSALYADVYHQSSLYTRRITEQDVPPNLLSGMETAGMNRSIFSPLRPPSTLTTNVLFESPQRRIKVEDLNPHSPMPALSSKYPKSHDVNVQGQGLSITVDDPISNTGGGAWIGLTGQLQETMLSLSRTQNDLIQKENEVMELQQIITKLQKSRSKHIDKEKEYLKREQKWQDEIAIKVEENRLLRRRMQDLHEQLRRYREQEQQISNLNNVLRSASSYL